MDDQQHLNAITIAAKLKALPKFGERTVQELANYLKNLLVYKEVPKINACLRAALVDKALTEQCKREGLEPSFENKLYRCLLVLKWTQDDSSFFDYILWLDERGGADYQQMKFGLLWAGLD